MKGKKFLFSFVSLLILSVVIHLFSADSNRVETIYSTGFFPYFSNGLRFINSKIPFSIGDIFYGLAFLWIFTLIIKVIWLIYKRELRKSDFYFFLRKAIIVVLEIYIIFNLFWGINYNRLGIANQLGFTLQEYSRDELKQLNAMLIQKVNESKSATLNKKISYTNQQIFSGATDAYKLIEKNYSFLKNTDAKSIKSSMWGWLGNYSGFLGYYNPFTGEAQVNTTIPDYIRAFTTCHEIAHQLGYAKENEANFVGYLACAASKDTFFRYSVYLDMFVYTNRNLFAADSVAARNFAKQLLPEVKNDIITWRKFLYKHQSPVEPVVRWIYGKYLQGNQQPAGVYSYDEVSGFLIGYYKKFGKI